MRIIDEIVPERMIALSFLFLLHYLHRIVAAAACAEEEESLVSIGAPFLCFIHDDSINGFFAFQVGLRIFLEKIYFQLCVKRLHSLAFKKPGDKFVARRQDPWLSEIDEEWINSGLYNQATLCGWGGCEPSKTIFYLFALTAQSLEERLFFSLKKRFSKRASGKKSRQSHISKPTSRFSHLISANIKGAEELEETILKYKFQNRQEKRKNSGKGFDTR